MAEHLVEWTVAVDRAALLRQWRRPQVATWRGARLEAQWAVAHMHGRSVPTSYTCCGHIAVRAAAVGCAVGSCRKRPFVANVSCLVVGAVMVNETEGVGCRRLPAPDERLESDRKASEVMW